MKLTYNESTRLFELALSYDDFCRGAHYRARRAGLKFNKDILRWVTPSPDVARMYISAADEQCRRMLDQIAIDEDREIAKSLCEKPQGKVDLGFLRIPPYAFQAAGIETALERRRVLIADDPGLGKTLEAIAVVHAELAYPCIVVCPASMKLVWKYEISRLLGDDSITLVSGRNGSEVNRSRWIIINYDILKPRLRQLLELKPSCIIFDESHSIKNVAADRSRAAKALSRKSGAGRIMMLTGTPILNRPSELVNQLDTLGVIDHFGGSWGFLQRYCDARQTPIWVRSKGGPVRKLVWDFSGSSNLDELYRKLRSLVMIRRTKEEVLTELPPKRHQAIILDRNGCSDLINAELEAEMRLEEAKKQAEELQKSDTFAEALNEVRDRMAIAFRDLARIAHQIALAKVPKAIEAIKEVLEYQDKLVVFAHHHDVIDQIISGLQPLETVRYTGLESMKQKDEAIKKFQEGSARVFVGSIRAAGVGLTLTRASQAIMVEMDWTPGVMNQATDRIHRIGQKDSVLITYIVIDGSIDARKVQLLISKQSIIDSAIDGRNHGEYNYGTTK